MKQKLIKAWIFILILLFFPSLIFAQAQPQQEIPPEFGCAACGIFTGATIFIPIAIFVINIAILIWVARDAKNRGMANPVLWMLTSFFLGVIGLIIYIFSRPSGPLVQCQNCNNRKLELLKTCPHCGHTSTE